LSKFKYKNFNAEIASPSARNDNKAEVSLRGALATKQSKFIAISSVFILGLTLVSPSYGDTLPGEELFNKKCKQCHKTTEQLSIGPGLKDVTKRRSVEWIEKWLIDPKKILNSDDPIAQELKKNFKRVMPKIPEMSTDENRKDIIEYLKTL